MDWTASQLDAKRRVGEWLEDKRQPVFRLFGYAGVGKTSIARDLAEDCRVAFCAYTGKATSQMRRAGCHEPTTIHRRIYQPVEAALERLEELEELRDFGELMPEEHARVVADIATEERRLRTPRFSLKPPDALDEFDVVVVDECSMVADDMAEDLLSFGVPLLVLGDPAQLPPVKGEGALTRQRPDVLLTEVHRQAENSPILRLATYIREGGELWDLAGRECDGCRIVRGPMDRELAIEADQVIVGKNDTRHAFNAWARKHLGFTGPLPKPGEKVICLRNNHDLELLNGETFWVRELRNADARFPVLAISRERDLTDDPIVVSVHREPFLGDQEPPFRQLGAACKFGFGYAITCHKSQGSGWDKVVVLDQSWIARDHKRAWQYTSITRAAKELSIYNRF